MKKTVVREEVPDVPRADSAPVTAPRVPMIGPPTAEGRSRAYEPAALLDAAK